MNVMVTKYKRGDIGVVALHRWELFAYRHAVDQKRIRIHNLKNILAGAKGKVLRSAEWRATGGL